MYVDTSSKYMSKDTTLQNGYGAHFEPILLLGAIFVTTQSYLSRPSPKCDEKIVSTAGRCIIQNSVTFPSFKALI